MRAIFEFSAPESCSECPLWQNYSMCQAMLHKDLLHEDSLHEESKKPLYFLKERASYCPLIIVEEKI